MTAPALRARLRAFEALTRERFDVLVVGGGINGAAIARDAALRGLRVALIEKDDFASGTSSRSSRLIHGGLRYLEYAEFHLVFESSRERRILLETAPHLVRPLIFTWPVYRGARVPKWKLNAGLWLYDALALFRDVALHKTLNARGILQAEPSLRSEGLVGGARYYDAETDDARLTLTNAIAAAGAGAILANHVAAVGIETDSDGVTVSAADTLNGTTLRIAARLVVNAAGPWSDDVRRLIDPGATTGVRGSKGVHIAVPRERIGNSAALTLLAPADGRVMFTLPGESHTIIGTTDTPTTAPPARVRASREDVTYLLGAANHFFPGARLGEDDVVAAWAGIRPLAAETFTGSAGSASREHALHWSGRERMLSITGGKLTTHRAVAEEVVDLLGKHLGRALPRSSTATMRLPGGEIGSLLAETATALEKVRDARLAAHLVRVHGSAWKRVWRYAEEHGPLAEPVVPGLPYIGAELVDAVASQHAMTLGDLLIRRTHIAFETRDRGAEAARIATGLVAPLLEWTPRDQARQRDLYADEVDRVFTIEQSPAA